jgi:hypothetical protein
MNFIKDDDITALNIVNITLKSIELVDIYKDINGLEKRHIVIKMLHKLVNTYINDDIERLDMLEYIHVYAPAIIDASCFASRGKYKINKKKKKFTNFNCLKI